MTEENLANDAEVSDADWEKLSPWSILHFIAKGLHNSYGIALGLLSANVASAGALLDNATLVVATLASIFLVVAAWRYYFFRYQFTEDAVNIKQGLFFRKQLNLKYRRIQNVTLRHPFYFRPIALITLKIDGAGSGKEEVYLSALTLQKGADYRQRIQQGKSDSSGDVSATFDSFAHQHQATHTEEPFYTRSNVDLVIHGLTNNRAWLVLGAIFAFGNSLPYTLDDALSDIQSWLGTTFQSQGVVFFATLVILSVVLAVVFTALLSVAGSILSYYNYQLYRGNDSLMAHCGLLSRNEINMPKSRIQTVKLAQDWLGLILNRNNVIYEQINLMPSSPDGAVSGKKLMVPAVDTGHLSPLASEVFDIPDPASLNYETVNRRFFFKFSLIWTLLYIPLILIWLNSLYPATAFMAIPLWMANIALIYLRWKRWGICQFGETVVVRSGVVGIDYLVFKSFKIQAVSHQQSVLMARYGLSNLIFLMASRSIKVPYLDSASVRDKVNLAAYHAEKDSRSYM